jgi:hypothetical protein
MPRDGKKMSWQLSDEPYPDLAPTGGAETRCESVTGGGRYRCTLLKGHEGKHSDYPNSFTTWTDES